MFKFLKLLWHRKMFYTFGFLIGLFSGFLSNLLGSKENGIDLIIISVGCSPALGYLLYLIKKEPERLKKEGPLFVLSKDVFAHIGASIVILIFMGLAIKVIDGFLK